MTHSVRRTWLIAGAVMAAALAIRGLYLAQLYDTFFWDERLAVADARYYMLRAKEIAAGNIVGRTAAFLSPGYVGFLAVVHLLFGASLTAAKITQALAGAASCGLLVLIGAKTWGLRAGMLAGALFAVYEMHIYYTGLLLPGVWVTFLNVLVLAVLLPWDGRPSPSRCGAAGLALGLAVIAKGNALLLVPALIGWLLWDGRSDLPRARALRVAALVLGATLAIAPVTVTNYLASDKWVLLNTTGGRNLYKGNGPYANGSHVYFPETERAVNLCAYLFGGEVDPKRAVAEDARLRVETWKYVRANPGRTLDLLLHKAALLLHPQELGARNHSFVRERVNVLRAPWLETGALLPVALVGVVLCVAQPRAIPLLLMLGVQAASFVLIFVLSRYRLVGIALLCPFAAWQLLRWVELGRARAWKRLTVSGAFLLGATLLVHVPDSGIEPDHEAGRVLKFLGDRHREAGEHEPAIKAYDAALQYGINARQPILRWRVMHDLAGLQLSAGRTNRAIALLDELVEQLEASRVRGRLAPASQRLLRQAKRTREDL